MAVINRGSSTRGSSPGSSTWWGCGSLKRRIVLKRIMIVVIVGRMAILTVQNCDEAWCRRFLPFARQEQGADFPKPSILQEVDIEGNDWREMQPTVRKPLHFGNVAMQSDNGQYHLHLYQPSQNLREMASNWTWLPHYKRFDWNRGQYVTDLPRPRLVIYDEPLDPAQHCDGEHVQSITAFFIPRHHTDNMFHLHNDNLLPLVSVLRHTCDPVTLTCGGGGGGSTAAATDEEKEKTVLFDLVLKQQHPEVQAAEAFHLMFDDVRSWTDFFETGGKPICYKQVVWGVGDAMLYLDEDELPPGEAQATVAALNSRVRQVLQLEEERTAVAASSGVKIVYLNRTEDITGRWIRDASHLFGAIADKGWHLEECCDWKQESFRSIVAKFGEADVVMGPHGSGLTHLLYAKPGALLVDIGIDAVWKDNFCRMARANFGICLYFKPITHLTPKGDRWYWEVNETLAAHIVESMEKHLHEKRGEGVKSR